MMLHEFLSNGTIRLSHGPLLDDRVPPKPADFDFGRVEGMLLGLAIGDALGASSESISPRSRREIHGEIRDYLPNKYTGERRGYPSDDSQLAFWTLEHLLELGRLDPEQLAVRFASGGRIAGIGRSVRAFLRNLRDGSPWSAAGTESAGNGALMRIAPVIVPHLRSGGTRVWEDVALAAMLTHNDRASTASCLAFSRMLWDLMDMQEPPPREWWRERFVALAEPLEGETRCRPRGGDFTDYEGPLSRFVDERLAWAEREQVSTPDACNAWHSGAFLLETVPSALLILTRHVHDPEEAIVRAVNDTRDNDTVAAIVGAAVGALHGRSGLPSRWIEGLSGWTRFEDGGDEGRAFYLIEEARRRFWDVYSVSSLSAGVESLANAGEVVESARSSTAPRPFGQETSLQAGGVMSPDQVAAGFSLSLAELDRHYMRIQELIQTATSYKQFDQAQQLLAAAQSLDAFRDSVSTISHEWKSSVGRSVLPFTSKPHAQKIGPHTKAKKTGLRITLSDGRVVAEDSAAKTLVSTLEALGLTEVSRLGLMVSGVPLVSRTPQPNYSSEKRGHWYVMTHSSTDAKKKQIERVAHALGVRVKVEVTKSAAS